MDLAEDENEILEDISEETDNIGTNESINESNVSIEAVAVNSEAEPSINAANKQLKGPANNKQN